MRFTAFAVGSLCFLLSHANAQQDERPWNHGPLEDSEDNHKPSLPSFWSRLWHEPTSDDYQPLTPGSTYDVEQVVMETTLRKDYRRLATVEGQDVAFVNFRLLTGAAQSNKTSVELPENATFNLTATVTMVDRDEYWNSATRRWPGSPAPSVNNMHRGDEFGVINYFECAAFITGEMTWDNSVPDDEPVAPEPGLVEYEDKEFIRQNLQRGVWSVLRVTNLVTGNDGYGGGDSGYGGGEDEYDYDGYGEGDDET